MRYTRTEKLSGPCEIARWSTPLFAKTLTCLLEITFKPPLKFHLE
ncbi:hypothetical protein Pla100_26860 [Neorhodopirellula pilleata]|uniref:Uncharacterized protein n=1 Tax=Neorhodopirellula pilleata TaxID=2714738 RepID=A0A5C6ABW1_9BACT|nr:hypothetical protein Pla100_26860 [Neorhodopirellula pilleata]